MWLKSCTLDLINPPVLRKSEGVIGWVVTVRNVLSYHGKNEYEYQIEIVNGRGRGQKYIPTIGEP